ncbi:MAG: hypothetical protein HZB26_26470 [Candidatus Hydrogenedentes bacterium]|nr:hypothetical protein [Candidatus Hydrogenedentota bacterium]
MKIIDGLRCYGMLLRAGLVLALLGSALASSASTGAGGHIIGDARHGASASIGALCLGESKVGLKSPPAGKTPEQGSTGKSEPPAAAPSKEAPKEALPAEVSSGTGDKDERDTKRERRLQKRREELKRKADEAAKAQQDKAVTAPPGDDTAQTPEKSRQAQSSDAGPKNTPPKSPQRHRFMWQARP